MRNAWHLIGITLLAACGGGDGESDSERLLREVTAKETDATAAAAIAATPCDQSSQCILATLGPLTRDGCNKILPYSKLSPTANQVETAAAEQRSLAAQYILVTTGAPDAPNHCFPNLFPVCSAGRCVAGL